MRRWLWRIAGCLVFGCATTLAIAWIHAAAIDPFPFLQSREFERGVTRNEFPHWKVTQWKIRGSTMIQFNAVGAGTPQPPPELSDSPTPQEISAWVQANREAQEGLPPSVRFPQPIVDVPSWSRASRPAVEVIDRRFFVEDARGWPFRAMVSYNDFESSGTGTAAIRTPLGFDWRWDFGSQWEPFGTPRGLPLKPIWLGFMADTLIFALLPLVPMVAFTALRAHIRRRRGRCLKCGYDLRGDYGSGCPECGWNRTEGSAGSTPSARDGSAART